MDLGNLKIEEYLKRIEKSQKSRTNERAELIKFFVENLYDKNKKNFPAQRIALALSHIPTKDLYFMISVFKDTERRNGNESANKWFWWSIKS